MSKHVLAKVQTPIQMPNQSLGAGIKTKGETTQGETTQGRNDSGAKRPEALRGRVSQHIAYTLTRTQTEREREGGGGWRLGWGYVRIVFADR